MSWRDVGGAGFVSPATHHRARAMDSLYSCVYGPPVTRVNCNPFVSAPLQPLGAPLGAAFDPFVSHLHEELQIESEKTSMRHDSKMEEMRRLRAELAELTHIEDTVQKERQVEIGFEHQMAENSQRQEWMMNEL